MAMLGFCANPECILPREEMSILAVKFAETLVEMLKNKD
jgi:hypothetical protein